MINVSAVLLDDALLKCVAAEVVLSSVVAFNTLTFAQGSVETRLRCGGIFSHSTFSGHPVYLQLVFLVMRPNLV